VLPAERRDAGKQIIADNLTLGTQELLDQYLKATGLEKEPESPLFPATIGLIESPSAVITASASLPADAIASISWSRDSRSPTRSALPLLEATGNGGPKFVFPLPRYEYFRRQEKIIERPERAAD
jgi:hypothetical protein